MTNRVGLGTYPLTTLSKEDACNIVREFITSGGFYIDTAPLYGFGTIETYLGEVLKEFDHSQYYMISKCGYADVEGKSFRTVRRSSRYDDVIRQCDKTLARLGLDYLDLYFVHTPDRHTPYDETMAALIKLQNDGKIKEIGVSNVNLDQLKAYNKTGKIKFVQNRFSLLNQTIDQEYEDYLRANNISFVPYHVIDRGLLTGKPNRLEIGLWNDEELNQIRSWVDKDLLPIANKLNCSLAQLSIAWALSKNFISFVLVGLTTPEHLRDNLGANTIKLSQEVLKDIKNLLP